MDAALTGTVIIGTVSAAALILCRVRTGKAARPVEAVTAFLSAGGLAVGVNVCLLSLDHSQSLRGLDGQRIYVFMAGLCMIWIAAMTALDLYRRVRQRCPRRPVDE